jgi:anthranilate/para-aminobenzoate synthase component II
MADSRRVVIIDNFDSYTHNLCDLVFEVTGSRPVVVRNDESQTFREMEASGGISCVILSPGPGRPHREADFGICRTIIDEARHPVFGVCLGFQGLALAHGMQVMIPPQTEASVTQGNARASPKSTDEWQASHSPRATPSRAPLLPFRMPCISGAARPLFCSRVAAATAALLPPDVNAVVS